MKHTRMFALASSLILAGLALAQAPDRTLTVRGQPQPGHVIVLDGEAYVPVSALSALGVRATGTASALDLTTASPALTATFDTGDDGWTVAGDAQGGGVRPTFVPTGGAAGGYIAARDDVAGGTWYWRAPSAFRGDHSGAYGGALAFSLRQSSVTHQFSDPDVILKGGGTTLVLALPRHPGLNWTPYRVALTAGAGWRSASLTGPAATAAQVRAVLRNLDELSIRGEYVEGADTGGLDSVTLTQPMCAAP